MSQFKVVFLEDKLYLRGKRREKQAVLGIWSCKCELACDSPDGLRLLGLGLRSCDPVGLWLGQIVFFDPDNAAPDGPGNTM